jgi:hypothetical protein
LLGTGPLTVYFYRRLLDTHAQSLHGAIAASASSSSWVIAFVVHRGALGEAGGWLAPLVLGLAAALGLLALWGPLGRLSATRRPSAA